LRSFQQQLADFDARGLRVVAISTDPPEVTRQHCQKLAFTLVCLSDANAEVTARYGLLHERGGPQGANIARPAEFLIDTNGTVRWVNLTESVTVRARPKQVLKAFDNFKTASPGG
jgi:peroxiredoxin